MCLYLLAFSWNSIGLPSHLLSSTVLSPFLPYLVDYPKVIAAVSTVDAIIGKSNWPGVVAAICFPIMFGKQIINAVQFWKASKTVSLSRPAG